MTRSPEETWTWRKSTYCASNSCLEVAFLDGWVALRDSKETNGPVLMFNRAEWSAFLKGASKGEFNPSSAG